MDNLEAIGAWLLASDKDDTATMLEHGRRLAKAKAMLKASKSNLKFGQWLAKYVTYSQNMAGRRKKSALWYDNQPAGIRHCVDSSCDVSAVYLIAHHCPKRELDFDDVIKLAKKQPRIGARATYARSSTNHQRTKKTT